MMVSQLECGYIFFTLSAADTHWPDLHRLIEKARAQSTGVSLLDISILDPDTAQHRRMDNVIHFPHICAAFLHHRFRLFLDVIKRFQIWSIQIIDVDMNDSSGARDISMMFFGLGMIQKLVIEIWIMRQRSKS